MTIEVMTLITVISITIGIISTIINLSRNSRNDTKNGVIEIANLNNKMDNVLVGISELKGELSAIKLDQKESHERIIILEQKVKLLSQTLEKVTQQIDNRDNR